MEHGSKKVIGGGAAFLQKLKWRATCMCCGNHGPNPNPNPNQGGSFVSQRKKFAMLNHHQSYFTGNPSLPKFLRGLEIAILF